MKSDVLKQQFEACMLGGAIDTNASLAGQIAGALYANIPAELLSDLKAVDNYEWMRSVVERTKACIPA